MHAYLQGRLKIRSFTSTKNYNTTRKHILWYFKVSSTFLAVNWRKPTTQINTPPIIYFSILFIYILADIVFFIYIVLFCFSPFFNKLTERGITAPFRTLIWKHRWPKNLIKALKSLKSKWIPDNVSAVWRKKNTGGLKKEIHFISFIYIYFCIYSYHSSQGSSVSGAIARGGRRIKWNQWNVLEIIEI